MTTSDELAAFLAAPEGARLEFKAAMGGFHFEELLKYIVALANEGGGKIIFGVTDKRPRRIVGTTAFDEPGRTEAGIFERLHRRVPVEELHHHQERVVVVHVPPRPPGSAWSLNGTFWMRAGDRLEEMTDEQLRVIHLEAGPDFSAELCPGASLSDLAPDAIAAFRHRWAQRTQNERILGWPDPQTLGDAELAVDGRLTFAALILFGTRAALGRHLAQAEVIFEYRSSEASGTAADRQEFREGLFLFHDRLWDFINKRNDRQSYQDGLFVLDIPTFDERPVREAVLNAVCHRDYHLGGSVFVRQFPRRLEVVSPGGFPPGVTPENILEEQNPRNRRLAEALGRCGLVERAGQGMNLMFERAIRHSKPLPDFTGSAAHKVCLTLQGTMTDPAFVRFMEKIGQESLASFATPDFLVLDLVHREQAIPAALRSRLPRLREQGLVESVGRGRGVRYLLSRRLYSALGQAGTYTRRRGLDHETNKEILLKHLSDNAAEGCPLSQLQPVTPNLSRRAVQRLLEDLRATGRASLVGAGRGARWFPRQKRASAGSNPGP